MQDISMVEDNQQQNPQPVQPETKPAQPVERPNTITRIDTHSDQKPRDYQTKDDRNE